MYMPWKIDGKSGIIQYPKGEVVYQTNGVVIQPVYVEGDDKIEEYPNRKHYIEENGKLLEVLYNPYNGYCYRQDGQ